MTETFGLTVELDSYEFSGRFWFRASDYDIDVECEPGEHEIAWVADDLRERPQPD